MHTSPTPPRRRRTARLLAAGAAAGLLLVVGASPAGADTAEASATGLRLAGSPIPGTVSASNDGTQGTVTAGGGASSVLPANPVLGAGAIGQVARAAADGTSAACAGLVAPSSVVTVAPNGTCNPGTATSGITLNLAALLAVNAGAIVAECTATSTGAPAGRARLVGANATLAGAPLLALAANPTPNSGVNLANLVTVTLNSQQTNPDGSLTVTALSVTILGQGLIEIGQVTCGPNEVTGAIPLVPAAGLPIAAGTVLLVGGTALLVHRRRQEPLGIAA